MTPKTRAERIIDFHAHDYGDMELSEVELRGVLRMFLEAIECKHECTSNCRKDGCECACGTNHL